MKRIILVLLLWLISISYLNSQTIIFNFDKSIDDRYKLSNIINQVEYTNKNIINGEMKFDKEKKKELNNNNNNKELFLLGISTTVFVLFDYIGYNSWGQYYDNQSMNAYRIVQTCVQLGLTYLLYKLTNNYIKLPIIFNTMWWFGVMDYGYYGVSELTNGFGIKNWEGRGTYKSSSLSHMRWTPIGFLYPQSKLVPKYLYEVQASMGVLLGYLLINF